MICRLCLTYDGAMNSSIDLEFKLREKIQSITSVQILINDGLPATICKSCTEKVEAFYAFQKQIEESYDTLKHWIGDGAFKNSNPKLPSIPSERNSRLQSTNKENETAPQIMKAAELNNGISSVNLKYVCLICLQKFPKKGEMMIAHAKSHHVNKGILQSKPPIKCELCSDTFITGVSFVLHQQTDLNQPFLCSKCGERGSKDDCNKTMFLSCAYCGCLFSAEHVLTQPKTPHGTNSEFICELCQKRLLNIRTYRAHMKYHASGKQYTCEICAKSYFTLSQLKRHQHYHNPKTHLCSVCGNSFSTENELNRHLSYHNNTKNHKCEICEISFYESHHLKEHMILKHENLKTFNCEFCGKLFLSENSLKKHIKNHPPSPFLEDESTKSSTEVFNTDDSRLFIEDSDFSNVCNNSNVTMLPTEEYVEYDVLPRTDLSSGLILITQPSNTDILNAVVQLGNNAELSENNVTLHVLASDSVSFEGN